MLTESFLNSCFSLILCKKTNIKRGKFLYRDIIDILNFQKNKAKIETPIQFQTKFECLEKLCELLLEDKSIESSVDSLLFSKKFEEFDNFLSSRLIEELPDHKSGDILNQIRLRKKIKSLFSNFDELNKVVESVKEGSFDSIDNIVDLYENSIKKLYTNMMEENRHIRLESASSLDLTKDSFEHVVEMIQQKYDRENKTPTGFDLFDNTVFYGGFEPSRLYILAGGSGSGKSTLLNNWIIKGATTKPYFQDEEKKKKKKIYIYITLENTIEESLLRMYQSLNSKKIKEVLDELKNGLDMKKEINLLLEDNNSVIIMKYFPGGTVSVMDLMGIIDDIKDEYPDDIIMGLFVDYLDLLVSDMKYDVYRLELGYITLGLKVMAVQYNIPVITPTQMNRAVYRINNASELNLDQMGESMKKVDHADVIILMGRDMNHNDVVHGKVAKNRCGPSQMSLGFKVNFECYKFINVYLVSNDKATVAKKGENVGEISINDYLKQVGKNSKTGKIINQGI